MAYLFAVVLFALAACANGATVVEQGARPMVWPMPSLRSKLVSPYIIGGDDAKTGEFPHQVSMQISFLWILEQHICGATILNEEWVLTAAHCVKGVPWYTSAFILAGKSNLGQKEEGQQRSAVKKMFVHELYQSNVNGGVGPYDIGLIHLKTPLKFSATVQPAKLPKQDDVPTGQAILTGWGSTSSSEEIVIPNQLQKVTLPIIPHDECYAFIDKEAKEHDEVNPLAETNICVGNLQQAGQGACNGDSGGPLIQVDPVDGKPVVIGATSWGYFPCQKSPAPSVYTRVSAYVDWIKANTNVQ